MNRKIKKMTFAFLALILVMSAFTLLSSKAEATTTAVTWKNGSTIRTLIPGNDTIIADTDRATIGKTTGKWYWEITVNDPGTSYTFSPSLIGIVGETNSTDIKTWKTQTYLGTGSLYCRIGTGSSTSTAYGAAYKNDVIGIALDMDNNTITWYKNGVSQGKSTAKPSELSARVYPYIENATRTGSITLTANFGATAFKYAVPTGYNPYQVDEVTATPSPTATPELTPTATPEPTSTATPDPTATPEPSPSATPEIPSGDRAILTVTLTTGVDKEFDLPMSEVATFLTWYDSTTGSARYGIDKHDNNKGPFSKRTEYVVHDKILTFEVSEYNVTE